MLNTSDENRGIDSNQNGKVSVNNKMLKINGYGATRREKGNGDSSW